MFKFTEYVMYFAPMGIFGAIAYTVGTNGIDILFNYGKVIMALYIALIVFVIIVLFIACKLVHISFRGLIKAIQEPALLTFTTASSEAALPKAMSIMEKFGVPKSIVGFVMPTGYTFNLDGSTLYLAMAVLFSTQLVGINLSLEQQLVIMFALMLTSKGVAGVPRASLIVLAGTLTSFNIPVLGVAILLGIDQILDMGRTAVNLIGNCVATVVIARWENAFDYYKMNEFLKFKNIKTKTLSKTKSDVSFANDFEGPASIVDNESLYIFAEDNFRFVILTNTSHIHKERTSAHTLIVIFKSHTLPRKTECLARETCETDVKLGNILLVNLGYIACDCKIVIKVCLICFLSVFIPFAYKHRINIITESSVKAETNASDACE